MERETKSITTPNGIEVVLKTYITGREKRDLNASIIGSGVAVSSDGQVTGLSGELVNKRQDAAISAVVVSVNGSTENVLDTILDLKSEDYDAVVSAVSDITGDAAFAKKKTT